MSCFADEKPETPDGWSWLVMELGFHLEHFRIIAKQLLTFLNACHVPGSMPEAF